MLDAKVAAMRMTLMQVVCISSSSRTFSRSPGRLSSSSRVSVNDYALPTSLSNSSIARTANDTWTRGSPAGSVCKPRALVNVSSNGCVAW